MVKHEITSSFTGIRPASAQMAPFRSDVSHYPLGTDLRHLNESTFNLCLPPCLVLMASWPKQAASRSNLTSEKVLRSHLSRRG
jgi:hypothetical protein